MLAAAETATPAQRSDLHPASAGEPPAKRCREAEATAHALAVEGLLGEFGALVRPSLSPAEVLATPELGAQLVRAWRERGGLLAVRGWAGLKPEEMVAISALFGEVEPELDDSKRRFLVKPCAPIMRIGNTRDASGELTALFANDELLPASGDPQYRVADRRPMWHTDSTYRKTPPIGSALFCRLAPPTGAATIFADAGGAYEALDEDTKARLGWLECVCSMAHHDAKCNKISPDYPVLTEAQRLSNPPVRVPMVLTHPQTGKPALYGMNGSVCAIVPKGEHIGKEQMDSFELEAKEDASVSAWRDLLPFVTSERFVVKWQWQPGDLVVWDNRSTLHCATGFDHKKFVREMWRTTIATDAP